MTESETRLKGVSKVQQQYYLSWTLHEAVAAKDSESKSGTKDDDSKTCDSRDDGEEQQQDGKKRKNEAGKKMSRRKRKKLEKMQKRGVQLIPDYERSICHGFFQTGTCKNGEQCKHSHDLAKYSQGRPECIEGQMCKQFDKLGYCPSNIRCMVGSNHLSLVEQQDGSKMYVSEDKRSDEEKNKEVDNMKPETKGVYDYRDECNYLGYESVVKLRKKKYMFGDSIKETELRCRRKPDFRNKTYIAPLTTVGNLPFRRIMKDFQADITCGEMAVSKALLEGAASEWALVRRHKSEDFFGVQIVGNNPDMLGKTAQLLVEQCDIDFIDLNLGCPIDLITDQGAGSALLNRVPRLESIVEAMTNRTKGCIPIGLKVRTGWAVKSPTTHQLTTAVQGWRHKFKYGKAISYLSIHGRSRQARYTSVADWDFIHRCSARAIASEATYRKLNPAARPLAPIPVFGNGDILSFTDYWTQMERVEQWKDYLQEVEADCTMDGSRLHKLYNADDKRKEGDDDDDDDDNLDLDEMEARLTTCMIGRGALYKPWICQEIKEKRHIDLSGSERLDIYKNFVDYGLEHWGSDIKGINITRRFLLEWLSYTCRYVPVGILDSNYIPQHINDRPPKFFGRDDRETLLCSANVNDWIKISEMFLGPVADDFTFEPKHQSNSYSISAEEIMKLQSEMENQ